MVVKTLLVFYSLFTWPFQTFQGKILKKRFNVVQNVLKLKEKKSEIIDRKRINVILNNIKKKSKKNKIDTRITLKVWKSMINAFIQYEFRNFKKKR